MLDVFQGFEYVFVSHISFHGNLSVGSVKEYNLEARLTILQTSSVFLDHQNMYSRIMWNLTLEIKMNFGD